MTTMIDTKPAPKMVGFTAHDRCDRCIAQAYHLAELGSLELLLCNHHHRAHSDRLLDTGWTITSDQEAIDRLTQQPG